MVICGLTTNHCVSTTARIAGNLGFATWVVSDATAAFGMTSPSGREIPPDVMHDVGLTELKDEFATIATTDEVLQAL